MSIFTAAIDKEIEEFDLYTATFTIGGVTAEVGAKPMTPADFDYVNNILSRKAQKAKRPHITFQNDPTQFEGQIAMLVRKTRVVTDGELGDLAFAPGDRDKLMRFGIEKISMMFADLFGGQVSVEDEFPDAVKDAEKN